MTPKGSAGPSSTLLAPLYQTTTPSATTKVLLSPEPSCTLRYYNNTELYQLQFSPFTHISIIISRINRGCGA